MYLTNSANQLQADGFVEIILPLVDANETNGQDKADASILLLILHLA